MESLDTQNATAEAAQELKSWEAVIPFSVILPYREEPEDCENILEYLKPAWTKCRVYFPLVKYPVDVLEKDSPGWDSFKKDLSVAAFNNGTVLVSNGGGKKERRFLCTNCFLYDKRKPRKSSLNGDKKKRRGSVSCKPVDPKDKCTMYIRIQWDDKGYYLAAGCGNCMHSNHVRLEREQMPFPKRLRDLENETILATFTQDSVLLDDMDAGSSQGDGVDFPVWDVTHESTGTGEPVFIGLVNQIRTVDPIIKEISALYEGNSTEAEIEECKAFLAARMKECNAFLKSKIVKKKGELGNAVLAKSNEGAPKGKRVSATVVSNKKNKTHGTAHMR
jgi:hypothetical protein